MLIYFSTLLNPKSNQSLPVISRLLFRIKLTSVIPQQSGFHNFLSIQKLLLFLYQVWLSCTSLVTSFRKHLPVERRAAADDPWPFLSRKQHWSLSLQKLLVSKNKLIWQKSQPTSQKENQWHSDLSNDIQISSGRLGILGCPSDLNVSMYLSRAWLDCRTAKIIRWNEASDLVDSCNTCNRNKQSWLNVRNEVCY